MSNCGAAKVILTRRRRPRRKRRWSLLLILSSNLKFQWDMEVSLKQVHICIYKCYILMGTNGNELVEVVPPFYDVELSLKGMH